MPVDNWSIVCCFYEDNEDQVPTQCHVDHTGQSSILCISQAGLEIHQ